MATKQTTAVAKSDPVVENLPVVSTTHDYGEDAGAGFETTSQSDLTIPFLSVLQALSPEVETGNGKIGEIMNTVTGEVIDGDRGLVIIPCYKDVSFVEWVPRAKGGGLVARHDPSSDFVKEALKARTEQVGIIKLANGNDLVETHYLYNLLLSDDLVSVEGFALLAATSTKITPLKKFMTALYMMKGKPPIFANRARLTTVKEQNEKGKFANIVFSPAKHTWADSLINPSTERSLLEEAKRFRDMIQSGAAKMGEERIETGGAPSSEGGGSPKQSVKGGKAPF